MGKERKNEKKRERKENTYMKFMLVRGIVKIFLVICAVYVFVMRCGFEFENGMCRYVACMCECEEKLFYVFECCC